MQDLSRRDLCARLSRTDIRQATLNLTYRCNLKCRHCFTSKERSPRLSSCELSFGSWKKILDKLEAKGFLWLILSGGEPLMHKDFSRIYTYAFKKGFLITVFTNATLIDRKKIEFFRKYRPQKIEVSLYSHKAKIHDSVTQCPGSFEKSLLVLKALKQAGLTVVIKTVGLDLNAHDIGAIKDYSRKLLGRGRFKFDPFISAGLDGDRKPCSLRLDASRIISVEKNDPDIVSQYRESSHGASSFMRSPDSLYHCNSWEDSVFISPEGRIQFCNIISEYSYDLLRKGLKFYFSQVINKLRSARFKTHSKCRRCSLRVYCGWCPGRALLETGDKEKSIAFCCELAGLRRKLLKNLR
jgi:radical SAM protein with 4Fe4S-binding SPASM domain